MLGSRVRAPGGVPKKNSRGLSRVFLFFILRIPPSPSGVFTSPPSVHPALSSIDMRRAHSRRTPAIPIPPPNNPKQPLFPQNPPLPLPQYRPGNKPRHIARIRKKIGGPDNPGPPITRMAQSLSKLTAEVSHGHGTPHRLGREHTSANIGRGRRLTALEQHLLAAGRRSRLRSRGTE